jgi:hypothetical protein
MWFWPSIGTRSAVVRGKLGKVLLLFGVSTYARGINNRVNCGAAAHLPQQ